MGTGTGNDACASPLSRSSHARLHVDPNCPDLNDMPVVVGSVDAFTPLHLCSNLVAQASRPGGDLTPCSSGSTSFLSNLTTAQN